jgi:8-oxo-dGTP diphosphatase
MKKLSVTCAIIRHDSKVFAALRPEGKSLAGYWEFPGGKLEESESLFECIAREIEEYKKNNRNTPTYQGRRLVTETT